MSYNYVDLTRLNLIPKDDLIKNFLEFVSLAKEHKLYGLYYSQDKIVAQAENQNIAIGRSFVAKPRTVIQDKTGLLSLNCGNYDSSLGQLREENRYTELRLKFLKYLQSKNFGNLHLQDLSDDSESFESLENLGYTGFWIPNLIYSEGKIKNLNSGIGSFYDGNLKFFTQKIFISLHQGNLPNITNYTKNATSNDLLTVNCSIYQAFVMEHKKTILILTNTYISPFSTAADRLQNILQTVKNIKEIKSNLVSEYPDYTIVERFTGDMNIYGVNSLQGPVGLKASPWSFGLPLLSSIFTGRNLPNERELDSLQQGLNQLGYKFTPENNQDNQTIFIQVEKYVPSFLKPLFRNKRVGWQLDLCIVPINQETKATLDQEPFGDFDHSSLIIS
jgi:hypothetical protein